MQIGSGILKMWAVKSDSSLGLLGHPVYYLTILQHTTIAKQVAQLSQKDRATP